MEYRPVLAYNKVFGKRQVYIEMIRIGVIVCCLCIGRLMAGCSEPNDKAPVKGIEPVFTDSRPIPHSAEENMINNAATPVPATLDSEAQFSTPDTPSESTTMDSIQTPLSESAVQPDAIGSPEPNEPSESLKKPMESSPIDPKPDDSPAKPSPSESKANEPAPQPQPVTQPNDTTESTPPVPAETPEQLAQRAEQEALAKLPPVYARWAELLINYVDENGNVDYNTLRRKRGEIIEVARLLDELDPQQVLFWSQEEKKALWINAHNIFTLKLIVDNYPIKPNVWGIWYPSSSIMQISGGRDKVYFKVMDIEYTLREIEREILLKRYDDPRICFALSYASLGGAFLRNEPYYPHRLSQQLDDQARRFIQSPRGVKPAPEESAIYLSDIFIWYKDVLMKHYREIKKFRDRPDDVRSFLNCILPYLRPEDAQLVETGNLSVKFLKYDWQLNDKP